MPDFGTRNPSDPKFWDERFEQKFMPWDQGGVPEALRKFVAQSPGPRATLIPGCGLGYEVAYLSQAGWNVTAIDFSPAAVAAARAAVEQWADRFQEADFFAYSPATTIEFIYERAFLCALPQHMRPAIAARWAELLPPGGLLAGFFFFDGGTKGPPFGIAPDELDALLKPNFMRLEDSPVHDSVEVFKGKERWQVWRRL